MTRVPKDGRVIVRYDKRENDINVSWGNGVRQGTTGLILSAFTSTDVPGANDNPFFRELERRGFDLSTLKFQIDLKEDRTGDGIDITPFLGQPNFQDWHVSKRGGQVVFIVLAADVEKIRGHDIVYQGDLYKIHEITHEYRGARFDEENAGVGIVCKKRRA